MKRSLIFPSLSGWISLANMLAIVMLIGLFALIEWLDSDWLTSTSEQIGLVLLLVLTFPLATPVMVPNTCGPTWGDVIMIPLMIVLNAYLWGYCVAWTLNRWGIVSNGHDSDEVSSH
ncbi:MAG: hypothetical protein P8M30_12565 [Planctomycetaceae bacterium]|nr:hypothetical protein [Planctomycetaceae bacterium]